MKRIPVLIDSSGTVTCQSVMKGLRAQTDVPVEIVTVDSSPFNAGRYFADRWFQVPRVDDPGYFGAIAQIIQDFGVRLFVPIFDSQFPDLARRRQSLEDLGCAVAVSPLESVLIANEKDRTAAFFAANGFPAPALVSPEDARAGRCRFPLILKPRGGRSSLGIEHLREPREVELFLARATEDVVLQEAVAGREFTADVLCDFESRPLAVVPRERLETKSGVSTKGRSFRHPEIEHEVARMAQLLGIRGPANVQGFLLADGSLQWIEINPRFSGTLALTIAAGVNAPLLLLRCALGDRVTPRIGDFHQVSMMRYWEEVFIGAAGKSPVRLSLQPPGSER